MCVLCGELVLNVHWTDQKAHDLEYGAAGGGEVQRNRRRDRIRRVQYANNILSFYGLNLADWNGSKYILSDKKGNQKIVGDLGEMWPEAQKACGRGLDPLDPALLEYLRAQDEHVHVHHDHE
ncbi:MAG: hypothetical protein LBT31_02745 [Synergistaceae bacterium]|jgi:hypothetical protein|nr:hypothetical protein [Synergistaceae bacterium]